MGRTATPTAIKLATGNPGGKKIRKDEPKPLLLDDLTPPKEFLFSPMALKVWKFLAPKLKAGNLVAETDTLPLAMLCNDAAEMLTAAKKAAELMQAGKFYEMGGGKGKAFSPVVSVRNAAHERFNQGAAKFGMTPADRTKLIAVSAQLDIDFGDDDLPEDEAALEQTIQAAAESMGVVVQFKTAAK